MTRDGSSKFFSVDLSVYGGPCRPMYVHVGGQERMMQSKYNPSCLVVAAKLPLFQAPSYGFSGRRPFMLIVDSAYKWDKLPPLHDLKQLICGER